MNERIENEISWLHLSDCEWAIAELEASPDNEQSLENLESKAAGELFDAEQRLIRIRTALAERNASMEGVEI